MIIYIGTQNNENSVTLKSALLTSKLAQNNEFIFPVNKEQIQLDPKEYLQKSEIMIADVSYPTIQLGIEMGWADNFGVDIICVCLKGTALSSHLTRMSKEIVVYTDTTDLVEDLEWLIETKYNKKLLPHN